MYHSTRDYKVKNDAPVGGTSNLYGCFAWTIILIFVGVNVWLFTLAQDFHPFVAACFGLLSVWWWMRRLAEAYYKTVGKGV